MPRNDGRVDPGQPLRSAISARAWNRAQDAADVVLGDRYGISVGQVTAIQQPYTWAYCKATATVPRWGILAITGLEISPTATDTDSATGSFQDTPVLTGGTPSATTTAWCVAVEPIESGKIGRVAVSGVVQCKVTVDKSEDKLVGCGGSGLTTGVKGEGLILWKESGTGSNKWALVRIGTTATIEIDVITDVALESNGLKFTRETVYVIGKKVPQPDQKTVPTTKCT